MTLYRILYYPHVLLKKKSTPIVEFTDKLRIFLKDLIATAEEFKGGGLAAPQVGVNKRIFVCNFTRIFDEKNEFFEKKEDDFLVYDASGNLIPYKFPMICINPEILSKNNPIVTNWEGCLSLPEVDSNDIARFHEIEMKALDEFGNEFRIKTHHLYAAVNFQHEIDHLDGMLMIDRWDKRAYTVKNILNDIETYKNDPQLRKRLKKLNLEDASNLKFV